ncbi:hypothetical protein CEQ90_12720, partial [Lewinellaceae bacterium SD302]
MFTVPAGTTVNYFDGGGEACNGEGGAYANNQDATAQICPDAPGSVITIEFLEVDIETRTDPVCWDFLNIFDGDDVTDPQVFTGCGEEGFQACASLAGDGSDGGGVEEGPNDIHGSNVALPLNPVNNVYTSTDASGCLTVNFTSDGSVPQGGWVAEVTATSTCPPAVDAEDITHPTGNGVDEMFMVPPGATVSYVDAGGEGCDGEGSYPLDQNSVARLCPDGSAMGSVISIEFLDVDLETRTDPVCWDFLNVYDGNGTGGTQLFTGCGEEGFADCAVSPGDGGDGGGVEAGPNDIHGTNVAAPLAPVNNVFTSTDISGCLTVEFISDGSVDEGGWVANVMASGGDSDCESNLVCNDIEVFLDVDGQFVIDEMTEMDATAGSTFTPGDELTFTQDTFMCGDVGTVDVTIFLNQDGDEADDECDIVVTVTDSIAPTITLTDGDVTLDDQGNAVLIGGDDDAAEDACGLASVELNMNNFGCEDIGMFEVEVTATDVNGNVAMDTVTVTINFTEPDLGCITEINVTLNENCQTAIIPEMVLAGNTVCLDQFAFDIVVMDDDTTNGPIIDGCGRFIYTIETGDGGVAPTVNGFVGDFAPDNFTTTLIGNGAGGDVASVDFAANNEELTLSTSSDFTCGGELSAEATIMIPSNGTIAFDFEHNATEDASFDIFMVSLEGTMTDITSNNTSGSVSEEVETGAMLMFKATEVDGCFSTVNDLIIRNLVFQSNVAPLMELQNFLGCWGYVNAEDKTSPRIQDSIVAPAELFCVDLPTVNLNELPANVSRCFEVDAAGNVAAGFYFTALGQRLAAGSATGVIPGFFDGCSAMEICVN